MKSFTLRIFNSFTKSRQVDLWTFACFLCFNLTIFGQTVPLNTSVHADFGVDAGVEANVLEFNDVPDPALNTDDWVNAWVTPVTGSPTGKGVIDETDAATIALLQAGDNIQAIFDQAQPPGWEDPDNGNIWLDAVYLRDQKT